MLQLVFIIKIVVFLYTYSKFLPRFSVMQAAAWVLSYSMASSSSSEFMRAADLVRESSLWGTLLWEDHF